MHFLFIYPTPGILGGIETLLSRMSGWLVNQGHQVTLLVKSPDNWSQTLSPGVKCIPLGERYPELYYYYHARKLWKSLGLSKPDVIKSFDIGASWIACQLATIVGDGCKVITGMYGAFFFKWYYNPKVLRPWSSIRLYKANYLNGLPENLRLFCGVDQIEELQEVHKTGSVLWPIPIDTTVFDPAVRRPKWGKIVSVGRISPAKEYNFYMIDVVRELRKRGHDVTWTVYGTGDYAPEVQKRIKEEGLQDVISMEGTVPYRRFWQVLSDAWVFVGMGTSILEAALFQVPSVGAVAYDRIGLTYGPVYGAPPGSMSPSLAAPPKLRVADEIERMLKLSPAEYEKEQELVYAHVRPNEMDASMNQFLKLVEAAKPPTQSKAYFLINYPRWCIHRAVNCVNKRLGDDVQVPHPEVPPFEGLKNLPKS